jgi:hypothetical protein
MRLVIGVVAGIAALSLAACSSTRDLPSVTSPTVTTQVVDDSGRLSGDLSAPDPSVRELEVLLARLLASNDACAILTQRDVRENQLDPSLFSDPAARSVLADGLVRIFDHLVLVSPPSIHDALRDQQQVYADVLAVVDEYADNPEETEATDQIDKLLDQPSFLLAQAQINRFILISCT